MIGHKNARIRRSGKKKIKIDTNGSEGRCQIRILKIKQMHTINLLTLLCITVVFIYFVISTRHPICCFVSYTLFRFLSFALECFLLFQLLPSGPLSFDRKFAYDVSKPSRTRSGWFSQEKKGGKNGGRINRSTFIVDLAIPH
jgi:hypothetical protein